VGLRLAAYAVLAVAAAAAWFMNRRSVLPAGVITAMTMALPWLHTIIPDNVSPYHWRHEQPLAAMYAVVGFTCVFLAWWGVREASKVIVNFGIAAFALTVMWFYFSNIMGKLDRSLGLIVLGVLFLAGGWLLERTRRRLVASFMEVTA
jgi:uncharacterized membrane protein